MCGGGGGGDKGGKALGLLFVIWGDSTVSYIHSTLLFHLHGAHDGNCLKLWHY